MKAPLCVGSLALLLAASTSFAGTPGFNLSWSGCDTSPASTDRSYVCDGQRGSPVLLQASFRTDRAFPDFAGVSAVIDCVWNSAVPDYWRFDSGGCDYGMVGRINPSALPPCTSPSLFDPTESAGDAILSVVAPNVMRIRVDSVTGVPKAMTAGALYGGFRLSIEVDQGALNGCAGCAEPAVFTLRTFEVFGFGSGEDYVFTDVPDVRAYVTWQAQGPTPARNVTWGAVKALYR